MRIVGIIFVALYILIGFALFVGAVHRIGGLRVTVKEYYKNVFIFVLSGLTVFIGWPIWYLIAKISSEKEKKRLRNE